MVRFTFDGIYEPSDIDVENQRFECELDDESEVCPVIIFTEPGSFTGSITFFPIDLPAGQHTFEVTAFMDVDNDGGSDTIEGGTVTFVWTVVDVNTFILTQKDGTGADVEDGGTTTSDQITFTFNGDTTADDDENLVLKGMGLNAI